MNVTGDANAKKKDVIDGELAARQPRCRWCGYELRGLTVARCPECGQAFDPTDVQTMRMSRIIGPLAHWALRPPGWPLGLSAVANAAFSFAVLTVPGGYTLPLLANVALWMFIGGVWALRLLTAGIVAFEHQRREFVRMRAWLRWAVVPAILLLVLLMARWQVPLRVTFWSSRGALEMLAAQALSRPQTLAQPDWVGWFPVHNVEAFPGGVRFLVRGTGFLDQFGLAYSPDGPPPGTMDHHYRHLSGDWYVWRLEF